jgi:hypothetical protein
MCIGERYSFGPVRLLTSVLQTISQVYLLLSLQSEPFPFKTTHSPRHRWPKNRLITRNMSSTNKASWLKFLLFNTLTIEHWFGLIHVEFAFHAIPSSKLHYQLNSKCYIQDVENVVEDINFAQKDIHTAGKHPCKIWTCITKENPRRVSRASGTKTLMRAAAVGK